MNRPLPLIGWASTQEIEKIAAERDRLLEWMRMLPRGHRKRIELEIRQKALTTRQLELEAALRDRPR